MSCAVRETDSGCWEELMDDVTLFRFIFVEVAADTISCNRFKH